MANRVATGESDNITITSFVRMKVVGSLVLSASLIHNRLFLSRLRQFGF